MTKDEVDSLKVGDWVYWKDEDTYDGPPADAEIIEIRGGRFRLKGQEAYYYPINPILFRNYMGLGRHPRKQQSSSTHLASPVEVCCTLCSRKNWSNERQCWNCETKL